MRFVSMIFVLLLSLLSHNVILAQDTGTCRCDPRQNRVDENNCIGGAQPVCTRSGNCFCKVDPSYSKESVLPKDPTGFSNVGEVVSKVLSYVYVFAGIALLVMLIAGGLSLMTAAGDEGKVKAGYGKISGALIGFLIIFLSYLIAQLVEVILGVKIL